MSLESPNKVKGFSNLAFGADVLPAVSGKSYRIKHVILHAANTAASTGAWAAVSAVDPTNGTRAGIAGLKINPGVVNCSYQPNQNIDFVTKTGTSVLIVYSDNAGVSKAPADFEEIGGMIVYTEIDQ